MILPHIPPAIVRLRVTPDEPVAAPAEGPPVVAERRPGMRRPFADSTIQQVRHLIETTSLSQKRIAARTGVKPSTVSLWQRNYGWTRPPGAPRNPTIAALWRVGPALKLTLLTGRLVAIAERMTRELEETPDTDLDKLVQALQVVRMARVTLQGNRRRKLLIGRARTGAETMKQDEAIRAAIKEMHRGGVDIERAPKEALDLVIEANTPAEQHPALRERGERGRGRGTKER